MSITKSLAPAQPVAGGPVTFTLAVANTGPSTARDVVVSDELIAALGGASATVTGGGTCQVAGQQVTCSLPSLASGATATVTVRTTVDPGFTGAVTNTATVKASTPDPDQSNNSASVTEGLGDGACPDVGSRVTRDDLPRSGDDEGGLGCHGRPGRQGHLRGDRSQPWPVDGVRRDRDRRHARRADTADGQR